MADEVLTRARSHRVQIRTDTVNSEREHVFTNMRMEPARTSKIDISENGRQTTYRHLGEKLDRFDHQEFAESDERVH